MMKLSKCRKWLSFMMAAVIACTLSWSANMMTVHAYTNYPSGKITKLDFQLVHNSNGTYTLSGVTIPIEWTLGHVGNVPKIYCWTDPNTSYSDTIQYYSNIYGVTNIDPSGPYPAGFQIYDGSVSSLQEVTCGTPFSINGSTENGITVAIAYKSVTTYYVYSIGIVDLNEHKSSGNACNHNYEWTVEKEPTATEDGEAVYECTKCGNISARQPLTAYQYYVMTGTDKIKKATAGSTVTLSSRLWNSFPKSFFEELAKRRDITVNLQFPYDGKYYEIKIAPTQTIDTSDSKVKYFEPKYMMGTYNATEIDADQMK